MHLGELIARGRAPAPYAGSVRLSRVHDPAALTGLPVAAILLHDTHPQRAQVLADATVPVVVCSPSPNVAEAVAMVRAGAADYVPVQEGLRAASTAVYNARRDPCALEALALSQAATLDHERLERIGNLSWGLSHEILNPATFISANLEELRACIEDLRPLLNYATDIAWLKGDPARLELLKSQARFPQVLSEMGELLDEGQQGLSRIRNIVGDLRSFGPDHRDSQDIDLRRLLERLLGLSRPQLQGIRIQEDIRRVPPVHASPARIAALLSHLLATIARRSVQPGPRGLQVLCQQEGAHVVLRMWDSAPLTPDSGSVNLARPNLGVAFGQQVVSELGGELSLEDADPGLLITLRLPVVEPHERTDPGQRTPDLAGARIAVFAPEPRAARRWAQILRCEQLHLLPDLESARGFKAQVDLRLSLGEELPGPEWLQGSPSGPDLAQITALLTRR